MRCYLFSAGMTLDHLRIVERPNPAPGPRDIVLRMRAAALNFRDLAIVRGRYHVGVSPPLVPLSDGAGEVIATGNAVTRFRVGDLACPSFLPDWIDGPIRARLALRRLGGPTDGVLSELMACMRRKPSGPRATLMPPKPVCCRSQPRRHGTPSINWARYARTRRC